MKKQLQPWIAKAISSDLLLSYKRQLAELIRRCRRMPHTIHIFLKVDDPYSYVLVQALIEFEKRYNAIFKYHIVANLQDNMFPEPTLWVDNAFQDAAHIAALYRLDYPNKQTSLSADVTNTAARQLLDLSTQSDFAYHAANILKKYWSGELHAMTHLVSPSKELADNDELLTSMGHYYSAMLYYAGEWYWGVDRLGHLEKRLNELGATDPKAAKNKIVYKQTVAHFCKRLELTPDNKKRPDTPLTLFFSARSPYSYLGLERVTTLANHYRVPLEIKPVLPMMMRNMDVPPTKKWYIFHDTKREAKHMGIEYGFVADPLGRAVERCYALFDYAKSEGKATEFLLSFARAVNANGIRADNGTGLQKIVEESGLNWQIAKPLLFEDTWRRWADENYAELHKLGMWGVPCIQYGDLIVWGQDRIDVIEQAICQSITAINA